VFRVVHDHWLRDFAAANPWRQRKSESESDSDGDSHAHAKREPHTNAVGSDEPALRLQPEHKLNRCFCQRTNRDRQYYAISDN